MTRRLGLVVIALALVASACGSRVRQEEWDALAAERGVPTVTTRAANGGGDEAASGAESDTTRTTRRPSSSGRSGASDAAGDDATTGALPAPADGTYTYDETSDGDRQTTAEQWAAQRGADSVALTSVTKEDDEGDTVTTTTKYRVTRAALELVSETSEYNGEDPEACTYQPAVLVLKLPLKVGTKWKTSGNCAEDGAGPGASDEDLQVEVTATATDTIGGTAVKTFIVRATQSFDSTDDTTGERSTFTLTDTRHVDPTTLLVVIEDIAFDADGDKSTVHRQLRSLTPT